jgi:hypothetical protein
MPSLIPESILVRALEAIRAGDADALSLVLAERPDLGASYHGSQLLMEAAELGQARCVAVLLAAAAPAGYADELGDTPLISAAWKGHLEVARMLLAAGADPDAAIEEDGSYGDPRASGRCALFCALYRGHSALVDLLEPVTSPDMRERARVAVEMRRACDAENASPYSEATTWLFMATQEGRRIDKVREAIAEGADVNAMLEPEASNRLYGSTPLSFAASRGRMDMVTLLLEVGADPGLRRPDGRTAADFAELNGHHEIASALRAAPRSHDRTGDAGQTS